jgi:hypothetical protein
MNPKYADEESVARIVDACIGIQNGELNGACKITRQNAYRTLLMATIAQDMRKSQTIEYFPKMLRVAHTIAQDIRGPKELIPELRQRTGPGVPMKNGNSLVAYAALTGSFRGCPCAPLALAASGTVPVAAAAEAAAYLFNHPIETETPALVTDTDAWIASVVAGATAVFKAFDADFVGDPADDKTEADFAGTTVLRTNGEMSPATPAEKLRARGNPRNRHPLIVLASVVPFAEWVTIVCPELCADVGAANTARKAVMALPGFVDFSKTDFADWNDADLKEMEVAPAPAPVDALAARLPPLGVRTKDSIYRHRGNFSGMQVASRGKVA